jgi:hypothetical protein
MLHCEGIAVAQDGMLQRQYRRNQSAIKKPVTLLGMVFFGARGRLEA